MKTLIQVKDIYAQKQGKGYKNWAEFYFKEILENNGVNSEFHFDFIAKMYAYNASEQTQRNCAENADTIEIEDAYGSTIDVVDKQSILSESNIPKLD